MRQNRYRVTFDRDFDGVMKACAGRRDGKSHVTWITPRIMRAFAALHDAGHAHLFEVWNEKDELVGGGYGLALGRAFFTESQFSLEPNTSKLGFTVFNWHLARWGFAVNDGKWPTPTINEMAFALFRAPNCVVTWRARRRGPADGRLSAPPTHWRRGSREPKRAWLWRRTQSRRPVIVNDL